MTVGDLRSSSPQATDATPSEPPQSNKKRKLHHGPNSAIDTPQKPARNTLQLPSPREAGLSELYQNLPNVKNSSRLLLPHGYSLPPYRSLTHPTTVNPEPHPKADLMLPEPVNTSPSEYSSRLVSLRAGERRQQPSRQNG